MGLADISHVYLLLEVHRDSYLPPNARTACHLGGHERPGSFNEEDVRCVLDDFNKECMYCRASLAFIVGALLVCSVPDTYGTGGRLKNTPFRLGTSEVP